MHVTEHCETPKITRRWRRVGLLWACSCGQVWRMARTFGYGDLFWTWQEFGAPVKQHPIPKERY